MPPPLGLGEGACIPIAPGGNGLLPPLGLGEGAGIPGAGGLGEGAGIPTGGGNGGGLVVPEFPPLVGPVVVVPPGNVGGTGPGPPPIPT